MVPHLPVLVLSEGGPAVSAVLTLDSFLRWTSTEIRELVLQVARESGPAGFTAEDVRLRAWWSDAAPRSLSAIMASLASHGELRRIGTATARFPSSKSRSLGRYVLTVLGSVE